ncbi:Imm12 family immunity protein [Micromonospora sp. CA-111912]|uniref:Imm12 family immunity protein n=1 Tax=Micromonospora sp. CA-111912 TaxID=3239955 RepID=UPI003D8C4E78
MRVAIRFRHGGPERGLAEAVVLRRALKESFGRIVIDGLDEVDIFLTLGGSITSAEGDGGVHNLRYSAVRRRLTVNVVVPASEIERDSTAGALAPYLDVLARRIAERCAPRDCAAVSQAVAGACREALAAIAGGEPFGPHGD